MKILGTTNDKIEIFQNVCPTRTNLGLLQNLRNQEQCKRGIKYYD